MNIRSFLFIFLALSLGGFIFGIEKNTEKKSPVPSYKKPVNAVQMIKSKNGFAELWYDPKKWNIEKVDDERIEYILKLESKEGYSMFITDNIGMTLDSLKNAVLADAKNVSENMTITSEKKILINNIEVMILDIEGIVNDQPFKYHGAFWTGKKSLVQLLCYSQQNLFNEIEKDFNELLSGLVIDSKYTETANKGK